MSLLENWREFAYSQERSQKAMNVFWADYFNQEKAVYKELLSQPDMVVTGTVKELAERYHMDINHMVGFLDGINDSLKTPNPIEEMTEETEVSLEYGSFLLYCFEIWAKQANFNVTDEKNYVRYSFKNPTI